MTTRPIRLLVILGVVLLLSAAAVARGAPACDSPSVTDGPFLGGFLQEAGETSQRIWARADCHSTIRIRYQRLDEPGAREKTSKPVRLTASSDFTGVAELRRLAPGAEYRFDVLLGKQLQSGLSGTFRTPPAVGEDCSFAFAVGADLRAAERPFSVFDEIAATTTADIVGMLLMGDQVYADQGGAATTLGEYEAKYRENLADAALSSFLMRHPVHTMWDDHEIINNWDEGKSGLWIPAREAYGEYQDWANPHPYGRDQDRTERLYYSGGYCGTDFFVLDPRTYRDSNDAPDDASKSMLGSDQKQHLVDWLAGSRGKIKFIVSPVMWGDSGTTGNDAWAGFSTEREEIFQAIVDSCAQGVVLLSGDQHWTGLFRHDRSDGAGGVYSLYEFSPTPLGTPNRPKPLSPGPETLFTYDASKVFGLVSVDTTLADPALAFGLYTDAGASIDLSPSDPTTDEFRFVASDISALPC